MPTIKILEANRLIENAKRMSKAVQDELHSVLLEGVEEIARRAEARAPVWSGNLKSKIRGLMVPGRLIARTEAFADYAIAQEMGYKGAQRKAAVIVAGSEEFRNAAGKVIGRREKRRVKNIGGRGNRDHKRPMSPELVAWARGHGLNPFAVSNTIYTQGYKRQPFLLFSLVEYKPHLLAKMNEAMLGRAAAAAGIPQGAGAVTA